MREALLGLVVLAGAGIAGCDQRGPPVVLASGEQALQQICAKPASHRAIGAAIRDLNWRRLEGGEIPSDVVGNGSVSWSSVAASPRGDMIVAVGQLSGTSFCHVHLRQAPAATLQAALERAPVLGAPLGRPNFHQRIDARDVVGWHRTAGAEWRAVHLSVADPQAPADPDALPVMLEMTRAAS